MPLKNLLKATCFIVLYFSIVPALAQTVDVTGKVTDSKDGSPIAGVSILAKGTSAHTVTGVNGDFKLSVPSSSATLVITDINYSSKEVAISASPLNISLGARLVSFGYGLQPEKNVTGAVAALTAENFNQGAIFNPVDQLAGKVAGLLITEPGGDLNQMASIRLRGQSSLLGNLAPLFVVDGVIIEDAALFQNLPPEDIASYDVLKDASATAIYGTRGANGVIVVTTKKGSAGGPLISYSGLVASAVQSKYYDLLTPNEFRAAIGNSNGVDKGGNTDWQKAIGRTALQQRNSLSVSGGGNSFNYLGAVNYQDQQGIILNNDKKQLGLRFAGELKALADKLDVKAGVQHVNTTRKFTDYSIFSYVFNAPPTFPVKNPDGSYFAFSDFNEVNPVEHINQEVFGDKEYLTLANGSADYSITHGLTIGALGSITYNNVQANAFIPTFPIEGNLSQAALSNESVHAYNANIHINYDKRFGKSTVNLLGAYEYNDHRYNSSFASVQQNSSSAGFSLLKYKLIAYFARAAYSYDDRFYATATIRRDNQLIPGLNQHVNSPSLGVAYSFKKDISANSSWLTDLKLRAGYGATGNAADQNGVPLAKWEQGHGYNMGLDFLLFNGRVSGDMNYFNNVTKDVLVPGVLPTPPFVINTTANIGTLANKGFELSLTGHVISGRKLNWTAYGQISFIKTVVTGLSGELTINGTTYQLTPSQIPVGYAEGRGLAYNPISFIKTGYSPYVFYLPHYTGADQNGNQLFDGQTLAQNSTPKAYYIDPSPKFNYGITNSFGYGNWDLSFALRGVYGQKVFDNTLLDVQTVTRLPGNNVTKEALTDGIKDAPVASDKWLENASFLRLDNAIIGYSFKKVSFASALRVFISANNLFVITKYKGLDPEVRTDNGNNNSGLLFDKNINGSQNQPYIDANYGGQGYYPRARVFSLGVNVSLK